MCVFFSLKSRRPTAFKVFFLVFFPLSMFFSFFISLKTADLQYLRFFVFFVCICFFFLKSCRPIAFNNVFFFMFLFLKRLQIKVVYVFFFIAFLQLNTA